MKSCTFHTDCGQVIEMDDRWCKWRDDLQDYYIIPIAMALDILKKESQRRAQLAKGTQ